MKCGYVALIGKPNVGKSTIMNDIFNKKISIVTSKSQTTRNSIVQVYDDEDSQIIFIDTPGIHKPQQALGNIMNKSSYNAIRSADVAVFIVDAGHDFNASDDYLFEHLKFDIPLIGVFNKIDTTNVVLVERMKSKFLQVYPEAEIIEVSALEKFNINELLLLIKNHLNESERYFSPDDEKELINDKFLISEIIRERMLVLLDEEVPHAVYVKIDEITMHGKMLDIKGSIIIEKESQKGIVIGKKGNMIKKIGIASRAEMEKIFRTHVNLDLLVKVDPDWRNNEKNLQSYGFKGE
ncbi:MAG: GTPase Era [Bacilli bacterium]